MGWFHWIYESPNWEGGAIFALAFLLLTWVATLVFHRYLHEWFHTEQRANDMVGFVLSSFSVLYGLLVGLIAVAAYQNLITAADVVSREAASLSAMYHDLAGYPQPARGLLRTKLRDYTRNEIEHDWPQIRQGTVPTEGTHVLAVYMDDVLHFEPQDSRQQIIHTELLHQLNDYLGLRRTRLDSVTEGIPPVLWWALGIGALVTLFLISMLAMEIHVHLILGAAMSGFLGLVIFLIAAMDRPFMGEVSVDDTALRQVYNSLMLPNEAVNHSMAALISRASRLGAPRTEGIIPVAGRPVPGLYFGTHAINNTTDLVDQLVQENGGVVSLFVRSGGDYVRVATNARAPDGSRATGTILDPRGPAIQKIRRGEAYYGEAMAVGKDYITGYEPMKDASGEVIGIYCTGYLKP
jgi:hypothetical protein